jgi:hypothetical protein
MRYPVWSHDANPAIDQPLFRKSRTYCDGLELNSDGSWVSDGVRDRAGIKLFPPTDRREQSQKDDYTIKSFDGKPTITGKESERNAEFDAGSRQNLPSVVRAHFKIVFWPEVGDTFAVRVGPRVEKQRERRRNHGSLQAQSGYDGRSAQPSRALADHLQHVFAGD